MAALDSTQIQAANEELVLLRQFLDDPEQYRDYVRDHLGVDPGELAIAAMEAARAEFGREVRQGDQLLRTEGRLRKVGLSRHQRGVMRQVLSDLYVLSFTTALHAKRNQRGRWARLWAKVRRKP